MLKTYSITDFGAVSDIDELQTEKIQKAIDTCFSEGGGEVIIPEGTFLTGAIRLRSNVTLHLLKNACLKGSRNPEDYYSAYIGDKLEPVPEEFITDGLWNRFGPNWTRDYRFMRLPGSRWNHGLIKSIFAENIAIIGEEGSVIDGSDCYDEKGEEEYRGPHLINMWYCKNIHFEGYTAKDSADWAHCITHSENITMKKVTVLAGHDGIHTTICRNIVIEDSEFYTGDDCIAGIGNLNVLVKNCVLNSACSAFRFGGTNALIENCHMYGPCKYLFRGCLTKEEKQNGIRPDVAGHRNNMLSAFTYYSDFSFEIPYTPGNIIIRNSKIDYADRFLHFNFSGNEPWQRNRPLTSITFENIEATDISMPLTAYGDAEDKIDITFKNVSISMRDGFTDVPLFHVGNFKKLSLCGLTVKNSTAPCLIRTWTDDNIELSDIDAPVKEEDLIKKADTAFTARPI